MAKTREENRTFLAQKVWSLYGQEPWAQISPEATGATKTQKTFNSRQTKSSNQTYGSVLNLSFHHIH